MLIFIHYLPQPRLVLIHDQLKTDIAIKHKTLCMYMYNVDCTGLCIDSTVHTHFIVARPDKVVCGRRPQPEVLSLISGICMGGAIVAEITLRIRQVQYILSQRIPDQP